MATQTTHLSQYFGVPHAEFVKHGVYDALLGEDSRLHIDPLLIRDTKIPEFIDGYSKSLVSHKNGSWLKIK